VESHSVFQYLILDLLLMVKNITWMKMPPLSAYGRIEQIHQKAENKTEKLTSLKLLEFRFTSLSSTVILLHFLAYCFSEEASLAFARLTQFRIWRIQAEFFPGIN